MSNADILRHKSRLAARVTPSALKSLSNYTTDPRNVLLSGGLPSSSLFPFRSISSHIPSDPLDLHSKSIDLTVDLQPDAEGNSVIPLSTSLQYNTPKHIGPYLDFCRRHVKHFYRPPYDEWDTQATCGNVYGFNMIFELFCNEGDYVLMDEYAYTGTLQSLQQRGLKIGSVEIDSEGMIPEKLRNVIEKVRASNTGRCVVLYIVTTASNPTGLTMSLERRKEIYKIACEKDLVIIEDDPYHFLTFPNRTQEHGQRSLPTTLLELDTESRVLRLESFSKIMAPGLRMGFAIGPKKVIHLMSQAAETGFVQTSGPALSLITQLVSPSAWGFDGWCKWLEGIGIEYAQRYSWFKEAYDHNVDGKYANMVRPPMAGMFVWVQIKVEKRKEKNLTVAEFMDKLFLTAVQQFHVVFVQGKLFKAEKSWAGEFASVGNDGVPFVRCTFATVTKEQATKGLVAFNSALRELMQ